MSGRFQVFGGASTPEVAAVLRWRLISENGRPLALGTPTFPSFEAALADARLVQEQAVAGTVLFSTPDRAGWGWFLVRGGDPGGQPLARSARRYARRVECLESVSRFRQLAAVAELPTRVVVFRRSTPGSAVDA